MDVFTLDIPQSRSWTDDDLFEFCVANKGLRIERDEKGFIIIMSPSGGLSGYYSSLINAEIVIWNKKRKSGYVFDSSTGFLLADRSMRAPDVAYADKKKWGNLNKKQKSQFLPFCPGVRQISLSGVRSY